MSDIITEKRLEELREQDLPVWDSLIARDMAYSLSALLKIARAAQKMNKIADFGDRIYDVRERECKGWEGPKVTAYSKAHTEFTELLSLLPPDGGGK